MPDDKLKSRTNCPSSESIVNVRSTGVPTTNAGSVKIRYIEPPLAISPRPRSGYVESACSTLTPAVFDVKVALIPVVGVPRFLSTRSRSTHSLKSMPPFPLPHESSMDLLSTTSSGDGAASWTFHALRPCVNAYSVSVAPGRVDQQLLGDHVGEPGVLPLPGQSRIERDEHAEVGADVEVAGLARPNDDAVDGDVRERVGPGSISRRPRRTSVYRPPHMSAAECRVRRVRDVRVRGVEGN